MKMKAKVTITYEYEIDVPDPVAILPTEVALDWVRTRAQQRHESNCKYSDETWDDMGIAIIAQEEIH